MLITFADASTSGRAVNTSEAGKKTLNVLKKQKYTKGKTKNENKPRFNR